MKCWFARLLIFALIAGTASPGQAQVTDPDLEEVRRQGGFDLFGPQIQLIRTDADDPDVEDEIRIALAREATTANPFLRREGGFWRSLSCWPPPARRLSPRPRTKSSTSSTPASPGSRT